MQMIERQRYRETYREINKGKSAIKREQKK